MFFYFLHADCVLIEKDLKFSSAVNVARVSEDVFLLSSRDKLALAGVLGSCISAEYITSADLEFIREANFYTSIRHARLSDSQKLDIYKACTFSNMFVAETDTWLCMYALRESQIRSLNEILDYKLNVMNLVAC